MIEDLPAFWIDRTEVSNWHYREFLASLDPEAAQRHRPIWYPEEWSTRLDWLPVCGVSFTSAQAFAEWAGKRLPSALEWERAARGTDGRVTPRPDLPTEEYANIGKPFFPPSLEPEAYHDWVCQNLDKALAPVDSGEEGCSPEGLFHVLGNVREWTETMHSVVLRPSQPPVQSAMQYHAKGGAWDQPGPIATLHYFSPTSIEFDDITLGFRCAKSDFPER